MFMITNGAWGVNTAADLSVHQVLSKYYPGSYFGYDKEGAPVFIDPIGQIDFRGMYCSIIWWAKHFFVIVSRPH